MIITILVLAGYLVGAVLTARALGRSKLWRVESMEGLFFVIFFACAWPVALMVCWDDITEDKEPNLFRSRPVQAVVRFLNGDKKVDKR